MKQTLVAILAGLSLVISPTIAAAQSVNLSRSILPDSPYTLIFPAPMAVSGSGVEPVSVSISHPEAPLQCDMRVVPVEDTSWTADAAVGALVDADVAASWAEVMPGFVLSTKGTTSYQDATALIYEGSSPESSMGVPLTLVHTEAVTNGRGYTLDCYYATEQAENARPMVDFIIANFATRADADCCIGVEVVPTEETAPAQ